MPTKLLHIDSSILGVNSVSRIISAEIVDHLSEQSSDLIIIYRDLATEPLQHLSGGYLTGQTAKTQHEPALQHDLDVGQAALQEFLEADVVVIGAPMYNFTVSTQLKAWIDRLLVAGKTFRYTESGSEGLLSDKRVIIAVTRGGFYGPETALASIDHQEPFLRAVFRFMGIPEIEPIRAEGLSISPAHREQAVKLALIAARSLSK